MKPFMGASVWVNVPSGDNNGSPLAPGTVTKVNSDGSVNVRVNYDAPAVSPNPFRQDWMINVPFHQADDPAKANGRGVYGAFWPPAATQ